MLRRQRARERCPRWGSSNRSWLFLDFVGNSAKHPGVCLHNHGDWLFWQGVTV